MIATTACSGELGASTLAERTPLRTAISAAHEAIAATVADRLPSEAVAFALDAAELLVLPAGQDPDERPMDVFGFDCLDYCLLLADELDATLRRRSIEARGDTLRRVVTGSRMLRATGDGALVQ